MVANEEADETSDQEVVEDIQVITHEKSKINLNSLTGQNIPRTLRLTRYIYSRPIQILMDRGSTYNFIKPKVVQYGKLLVQPSKIFKVMVGNGQNLECFRAVRNLTVNMQLHKFQVNCYIIPIQRVDIVGVQWVELLGPYIMNYKQLTLKFTWQGNQIKLTKEPQATLQASNPNQIIKLLRKDRVVYLHNVSLA